MSTTEPLLSTEGYNLTPEDDFLQDDARSIVFNLHTWSYRLSAKEFAKYSRHSKLAAASKEFLAVHGSSAALTGVGLQQQPRHQWQQQRQQLPLHHYQHQQQQGTSSSTTAGVRRGGVFGGGSSTVGAKSKAVSAIGLRIRPINNPFQACWSILMVVLDMVYPAILLPLLFAFDELRPSRPTFWLHVAVGFVYAADMLVVLHRGVVVRYLDQHVYIDDPWDIFTLYLWHGHFLYDLPVALTGPLQLLELLRADAWLPDGGALSTAVNLLLLTRGLRLVRLLLLSRELFFGRMGFRHMSGSALYRWYLLSLLYVLAVLINWLACMMLFIARWEGAHSWLSDVKGRDLTDAPRLQKYMAACYWQLISTLTVGYGDITAVTPLEQAAVMVAVVAGVLFIGHAIRSFGDILAEVSLQDEHAQRLAALRGRTAELKVWTAWSDLPPDLEDALFRFYMGPWLTKEVMSKHGSNVLQDLPAQLRGQALHYLLIQQQTPLTPLLTRLLAGCTPLEAWHLLALLHPIPLAPGHTLCWQGDEAQHMWLLQEGALARLDGVVPSRSGIIQAPCLVAAFDTSSFLQQQQQQPQPQQQQQQQRQRATARHNAPASPMAAEPGQLPQQQQLPLHHADIGSSSSSPQQVLHTSSYQTVSTVFLWRLPLKQLALAMAAQPGLVQNLVAELAACNQPIG